MVPVELHRRERRRPVPTLDVNAFENLANNLDHLIGATLPNEIRGNLAVEKLLPSEQPQWHFIRLVKIPDSRRPGT